jgi:hypothetical protein
VHADSVAHNSVATWLQTQGSPLLKENSLRLLAWQLQLSNKHRSKSPRYARARAVGQQITDLNLTTDHHHLSIFSRALVLTMNAQVSNAQVPRRMQHARTAANCLCVRRCNSRGCVAADGVVNGIEDILTS